MVSNIESGETLGKPRRRYRPRQNGPVVAMLVLPFLVLFFAFYILPIAYSIWQSMFALKRKGAFDPPENVFVGLGNYLDVIREPDFHQSLLNVFIYGIGPTTITVIFGLLIALIIDARPNKNVARGARAIVFAPFAVPAVIGAVVWGFLYTPSISPISELAAYAGWEFAPLTLSPIWTVGNIAIWTYTGFNTLIFLAGLAAIDPSLIESARIDGATPLQIARRIKLPLLRPSIILSVVFNVIGTLQLFTEPTALRTLSSEIPSGWTPTMLAYTEAASNRYSYSATIAVLLAIVTAAVSFSLLRITAEKSEK